MGVEGKEAPALGPGPHRTSSRSVRALGFSRYFSRARQAEMRSGLSSILPRADEGEFILGALALASWVPPCPTGVLTEGLNTLPRGPHPVLPGLP